MKFLIDEDVPVKLRRALTRAGHQATRVTPSTPDHVIADQARQTGCILVTLDKDFTNKSLYPPAHLTIIYIQIHPPYADDIITAVMTLLTKLPPSQFKGLIILGRSGFIHILE